MNCCICNSEITVKTPFDYDNVEGTIMYYHIKCQEKLDSIFDAEIPDEEGIHFLFTDEEVESMEEE